MDHKNISALFDATAYDRDGEKLGAVKEIFVNDASGQPDFVEVSHGLFGLGSSVVPLRGHEFDGERLTLGFTKDRIQDSPKVDTDSALSEQEMAEIHRHYGVDSLENRTAYDVDRRDDAHVADTHAADARVADNRTADARVDEHRTADARTANTAAAGTNVADNEMVRSEERLNVSKERQATGEARLRKYVVREKQTVEVPVEREEVRVERTPINADEAANYRGDIAEGEAAVTLHSERVNVSKDTVPVEKVALHKDTVQDTETVSEEVAKEKFDIDGDKKHNR